MSATVLRIDTSARRAGSASRELTAALAEGFAGQGGRIIERDLAATPPAPVDEAWVNANFTPEAARTDADRAALAQSDALVAELQAADVIVIGVPIYNFTFPATLKAWIDQVARARVTFRYGANGPEGLLTGKRAVLALASGGVEAGSAYDFATGYLRHVLGFLGITDVEVVAADKLMSDESRKTAALDAARRLAGEARAAA